MKIRIQVIIEHDDETLETITEEIGCLHRTDLQPGTVGLTVNESKELVGALQTEMVKQQLAAWTQKQADCTHCGERHRRNGRHKLTYRTLFGKLKLTSPRFYTCSCQAHAHDEKSFSPLAKLLPERSSPELCYLQTKWASLMSYGMTVDLLEELLPMQTNIAAVYNRTHQTAQRMEDALGEEQYMFPHGSEFERENLPTPGPPLTMGIDGGYIHAREGSNRKAGWFEAIVGKSMQEGTPSKRFGFVTGHDEKSKRRVYETLRSQGMQRNQTVTFMSDGGDNVRDLQLYLTPAAEHILDWFHITMRLTVLLNTAKGLPKDAGFEEVVPDLERVKWYLWHGNVYQALKLLMMIEDMTGVHFDSPPVVTKLSDRVTEFTTYIRNNSAYIPNYGDRYRNDEVISSAFVESTVNELISKRMSKKQQMRWTKEGAHLLLQTRAKTLDGDLREQFEAWYPAMSNSITAMPTRAALSC